MNDKIEWVLVPREPTEAMIVAGRNHDDLACRLNSKRVYAAMLAAAPKPEAQAAGAMRRLRKFVDALEAKPMRGVDDEFYSIHVGTEWEASLSFSDLRAISTPASHDAQQQWCCFHCGDVFTDANEAEAHFGRTQAHEPACQIDPEEYRRMEALAASYAEEDAEVHRTMRRMDSQHQHALMRAKETGYERGLRDSGKCPCAAPVAAQQPAVVGDGVDLQQFRQAVVHWYADADNANTNPEWTRGEAERLLAIIDAQAALTPAATPGDGPSELRKLAKRHLRTYIESGSTDKRTMLLCLEELS